MKQHRMPSHGRGKRLAIVVATVMSLLTGGTVFAQTANAQRPPIEYGTYYYTGRNYDEAAQKALAALERMMIEQIVFSSKITKVTASKARLDVAYR